jgi:hypothetical protein
MSDIVETWKYIPHEDRILYRQSQVVDDHLELNKKQYNAAPQFGGVEKSGMRHMARIPNAIVTQWMKEGVNIFDKNHEKEVHRRLNSPEWRWLRTHPGRM